MALTKLFVRVTDASLRDAVITKSNTDNKIYFLTTTHEIITHGVVYGLSGDIQTEITKIKSILKAYYTDGTEDAVSKAIGAVQTALNEYKKTNDDKLALLVKTVAYNPVTKAIDFTSENGTTVQSIPVSKIIGNHLVKSSSYDSATNKLTLVFEGAENDVPVYIDLSSIYDLDDITTDDTVHFKAEYTAAVKDESGHVTKGGSLVIAPKIIDVADAKAAVEGEHATPAVTGLVDALDVKTYIDAAVSGATTDLQGKIDTINGKLTTIQGEETVDGSIKKALKDANDHINAEVKKTNDNLTQEVTNRKTADQALYGGDSIPETGAATISGNAASITSLLNALESEKTARETAIKEITDALANPATFWEDYKAPEAQA